MKLTIAIQSASEGLKILHATSGQGQGLCFQLTPPTSQLAPEMAQFGMLAASVESKATDWQSMSNPILQHLR